MAGLYVRRGEQVVGPIDEANLKELAGTSRLLPSDELSPDLAGPWVRFSDLPSFAEWQSPQRIPPRSTSLAPRTDTLPSASANAGPIVEAPASGDKFATVVRGGKAVLTTLGRGTVIVGGAIGGYLATRAQRRHEIKLAKIQSQASTKTQMPLVPNLPYAAGSHPPGPINFSPKLVQSTVVKVYSRNSPSGCAGCLSVFLVAALIWWAVSLFSGPSRKPSSPTQPDISGQPSLQYDQRPNEQSNPNNSNVTPPVEQPWQPITPAPSTSVPHRTPAANDSSMAAKPFSTPIPKSPIDRSGTADDARWRKWTTADGKYRSDARFVKYIYGRVTLEKRDGTRIEIDAAQLSPEDIAWIKGEKWKQIQ